MLKHKAKAELTNKIGKNKTFVDINWSKRYKDCLKFTIGDQNAIIPKAELFQLLFIVSNPEQQMAMIPVQTQKVRLYARKHTVKLNKDMKAGEILNVHCEINVPLIVENTIRQRLLEKAVDYKK